ncbi:hypothetical protein cypCar_00046949 [Cyprinus carpio]|nr:hypothetical protein cypCar_00046949 [Cyprinus carpio]
MEEIRERFKQKSSCESVRLRKRSSMLYSTEVFVPCVFQALLAAYADVKLYNLVLRWETPDVARWTRGPLDVMHDLQQLCDVSDSQSSPELLFLMPCHSTPLYR